MRNELPLPTFIAPEQTLIDKMTALLRDLDNQLTEFPIKDGLTISADDRVQIRRILLEAQRNLTFEARKYPVERTNHNLLFRYYQNLQQFVRMVDEMEAMFRQTLINCMPKKAVSEDELMLLEIENDAVLSEKPLETLFSEFIAHENYQDNIKANHMSLLHHIEQLGKLSCDIDEETKALLHKRTEKPIFLDRFFNARRLAAAAIEKMHHVIHHQTDDRNTVHAGTRRTRESSEAHQGAEEECCYEFGLISACSEMEKEVKALLKQHTAAQNKRIDMLKKICFLCGNVPELDSDAASSCSSSDTSTSRDSSLVDSGSNSRSSSVSSSDSSRFFSRSRSPASTDSQPGPAAGSC